MVHEAVSNFNDSNLFLANEIGRKQKKKEKKKSNFLESKRQAEIKVLHIFVSLMGSTTSHDDPLKTSHGLDSTLYF